MSYPPLLWIMIPITSLVATAIGFGLVRLGFPVSPPDQRHSAIDGLRGYLATAVIFHHFAIWTGLTRLNLHWGGPSVNILNQLGAGAVSMFFMITGFVFYPKVLAGFSGTAWRSVAVGRLFRIMPLVVFSIALVVVYIAIGPGANPSWADFLAGIKWLSSHSEPALLGYADAGRLNSFVLWSLRWEWIFYLFLLPACAAVSQLFGSRGLPTWLMPAAMFLLAGAASFVIPKLVFLALFAIGMIGHELQARQTWRRRLGSASAGLFATAALAAGAVLTHDPYRASLPAFALFFVCVACGNGMGGVLTSRGARALGECSFGIYLLHGFVLAMFFLAPGAAAIPLAMLPLALPLLILIIVPFTAATYLCIERPMNQLGKRVARRLSPKNRAAPAVPLVAASITNNSPSVAAPARS